MIAIIITNFCIQLRTKGRTFGVERSVHVRVNHINQLQMFSSSVLHGTPVMKRDKGREMYTVWVH